MEGWAGDRRKSLDVPQVILTSEWRLPIIVLVAGQVNAPGWKRPGVLYFEVDPVVGGPRPMSPSLCNERRAPGPCADACVARALLPAAFDFPQSSSAADPSGRARLRSRPERSRRVPLSPLFLSFRIGFQPVRNLLFGVFHQPLQSCPGSVKLEENPEARRGGPLWVEDRRKHLNVEVKNKRRERGGPPAAIPIDRGMNLR